jgi:RND family efflux transporter MFP subunit
MRYLIVFSACIWLFPAVVSGEPRKGPPAARVQVQTLKETEVRESVTLVGTAEARKRAVVASQVEGWVEEISFQEGDYIERGKPLARLEDRSLRIQLEGARASLQEAQERLGQAVADLKRLGVLYKSKSVAEKTFQDAQYEVNARKERVQVLRSEMAGLEDLLDKKTIKAPFSGWIAEQHAERGEWVDRGGPVATMVDLSRIHVRVPVPERFLPLLKVSDVADVSLDAVPGSTFSGRVLSLFPAGDPQSRTIPVKVEVRNSEGTIRAGMLSRVTLWVGSPRRAMMVPKDALVLEGPRRAVFIVNDEKAHRIGVQVLGYQGEAVEVSGDLHPGDLVVVRGNERIQDGQPVVINSAPSSSNSGKRTKKNHSTVTSK